MVRRSKKEGASFVLESLTKYKDASFEDAGDDVVVVGFGDFGAVEGAGDEGFVGAEVVDEDLAVDLGGVEGGAALPEEVGFFGGAFDEEVDLAAYP